MNDWQSLHPDGIVNLLNPLPYRSVRFFLREGIASMRTDRSPIRHLAWLSFFICFAAPPVSAEPNPVGKEWCFDTIKMKNGYVLHGLILDETAAGVRFQNVSRSSGRATVCITAVLRRDDIEKIDKLPDIERELLRNRLKELDPTGDGERKRMEMLDLKVVEWNGKAKAGRRYDSEHFSLISSAREEVVRRSAVRLEQIYAAYVHFLPPRFPGGKSTTILLYPSLDDYQAMLKTQNWKLQNPAFFDPGSNRIVCGSNLLKLGEDLEEIRQTHQEQRSKLDQREAVLRQLYGKKPLELVRHLQPLLDYRKDMAKADKHNDAIFDNETKRLFAILYHEAFHAYAANFVYPAAVPNATPEGPPGELPRWFNEGLAQIFETAIVEAGELRVGHTEKERLVKVKELLRKNELLPVEKLLGSTVKQFVVRDDGDRVASEGAYLASWALASYLTFDRRLLGSKRLDAFVRSANRGENAVESFGNLTGQKLPEFERDFHAWLQKLQTDGRLIDMK